jgi:3-dehydroshikimate dehydratase
MRVKTELSSFVRHFKLGEANKKGRNTCNGPRPQRLVNDKMRFMLYPGLVSITYRDLAPHEIITLAARAGLKGIEWGSDLHVPEDDVKLATEVGQRTRDAGLDVAAYGSYYRCDNAEPFEPYLETALALGAPIIRVWAGRQGSSAISPEGLAKIEASLYDACEMADTVGIGIVTEYHDSTLTDTRESCRQLLESIGHPNLKTLWQPLRRGAGLNAKIKENLDDLRDVAPYLSNVHVYEWRDIEAGRSKRFSLQRSAQWPSYIEELKKMEGDRYLLIEYVPEDAPEVLRNEAAYLRAMIEGEPIAF